MAEDHTGDKRDFQGLSKSVSTAQNKPKILKHKLYQAPIGGVNAGRGRNGESCEDSGCRGQRSKRILPRSQSPFSSAMNSIPLAGRGGGWENSESLALVPA